MSDAKPSRELVIPPPRPDRPPLRANLLNVMQKANTTLTPLFPYMHAGAIVPTGALFIGGPDRDYGQFYHHNSVDEVIIAFVANEATLQTGQVYNGGRVHGVNSFLKDQKKAGSFALFTVTQRQLDEGAQPEAITILCAQCRKEIFRGELDGASPPDAHELEHPFATIAKVPPLVHEYNTDPGRRTCPDCGHVNEPFPLRTWGWDLYAKQSATMAHAKQVLHAAASAGEAK
ncbi:cupin domain-containing protein [Paraliomyxa miuraensis]|uniref:hypothetical protein n=1 Tax=Paraliomyxa miuraensis TaxID=376150 RepID=UPI0022516DA6|nr:hypothetical protein [Paraliomyxa miuraensis]MCX4243742.1 hypothetical protein [Paraliomyxa miuraensis]